MATTSTSRYFTSLYLLILFFKITASDPNSTFDFKNFDKDSNFESTFALYGDAKVVNGGSSVQITGFSSLSSGRVFYKKPIKLIGGNPRKMSSFSTCFTFSISPESGDGLAFVMVPVGFPFDVFDGGSFGLLTENKIITLSVEFDTLMDQKYGDLNANHVGVDVNSLVSVKASNVSSVNLVLNSGEKLQAWIDYEAGSKRIEVRLSQLGELKPINPLLSCPIDLSQMWNEEEVFMGLSSSNRNSSQSCNLFSWNFKLRRVPQWIHSQPLDPRAFSEKMKALAVPKSRDCVLRVLALLTFGVACGALGMIIVLFVWGIFGNRRPAVVPEEDCRPPPPVVVGFEYEKYLEVVVDKAIEDGKK